MAAITITEDTVQKPTLSEIAKIFRPSKKDLITLACGILREERQKYTNDLNARKATLMKQEQDLQEEFGKLSLHKMAEFKGVEAKLKKILPDLKLTCTSTGGGYFNVCVNYTKEVKAELPTKLTEQLSAIRSEQSRIDDQLRCNRNTNTHCVREEDVLQVLVTKRMSKTGQLKALIEELTEAMREDVRECAGEISDGRCEGKKPVLQITVEDDPNA